MRACLIIASTHSAVKPHANASVTVNSNVALWLRYTATSWKKSLEKPAVFQKQLRNCHATVK